MFMKLKISYLILSIQYQCLQRMQTTHRGHRLSDRAFKTQSLITAPHTPVVCIACHMYNRTCTICSRVLAQIPLSHFSDTCAHIRIRTRDESACSSHNAHTSLRRSRRGTIVLCGTWALLVCCCCSEGCQATTSRRHNRHAVTNRYKQKQRRNLFVRFVSFEFTRRNNTEKCVTVSVNV